MELFDSCAQIVVLAYCGAGNLQRHASETDCIGAN